MIKKKLVIKIFFFIITGLFLSVSQNAFGQSCKGAIVKERLVTALRGKMQNAQQLTSYIKLCGVDFQLTPQTEAELVAAGARPSVIEAVRNNFRGASSVANKNNNLPTNNKNSSGGGTPISKDAILTLLQNGVADAKVQQNVKQRGVSFKMNPQTAKEIKAAGGSETLVNLLNLAFVGNGGNNNSAGSTKSFAPSYEDLISQALETYNADVNAKLPSGSPGRVKAIEILKQAAQLNASNPTAYQQLGFMTLYGTANGFATAEEYMRKAVELGGSAVFRVFHDHNGTFTDTCQGSLYVAKDGVKFESDDNTHTFDTLDANIQKVTMNNSFKQMFQSKVGSFKIVLKSEDKSGTKFSFAPLTNNAEESKMVIRLIGKN